MEVLSVAGPAEERKRRQEPSSSTKISLVSGSRRRGVWFCCRVCDPLFVGIPRIRDFSRFGRNGVPCTRHEPMTGCGSLARPQRSQRQSRCAIHSHSHRSQLEIAAKRNALCSKHGICRTRERSNSADTLLHTMVGQFSIALAVASKHFRRS